jgi:hypothetical protein
MTQTFSRKRKKKVSLEDSSSNLGWVDLGDDVTENPREPQLFANSVLTHMTTLVSTLDIESEAVWLLRDASFQFLEYLFKLSGVLTVFADRETVLPKDMQRAFQVMNLTHARFRYTSWSRQDIVFLHGELLWSILPVLPLHHLILDYVDCRTATRTPLDVSRVLRTRSEAATYCSPVLFFLIPVKGLHDIVHEYIA